MAKSPAAKVRRAKRRHEANPHTYENPALVTAMAERARSGAAGSHQGGQRGQRTRQGATAAAVRDSRE